MGLLKTVSSSGRFSKDWTAWIALIFDKYHSSSAASKYHYKDVAWAPWRLKLPANRLLFQQRVPADNNENISASPYWPHRCRMGRKRLYIKSESYHDDVIKWKHSPRYWPFVMGNHRLMADSPHKNLWRRALIFSLIRAWTDGDINTREGGHLRRHCADYDVTVMISNMNVISNR